MSEKNKYKYNISKINVNATSKVEAQSAPIRDLYELDDEDSWNPEIVDFDRLEGRELPVIREEDFLKYLADDFGREKIVDKEVEEEIEAPPVAVPDEEMPEFANASEALNWAIVNNKVVRINYTTKGGIDLVRIVEPYLVFVAGTGNAIVVTYDRSVRDIRAFIVNNILNYSFTGKEYKDRIKVLPKLENNGYKKITKSYYKGKRIMKKSIFENLKKIGDELDDVELSKSAEVVTDSMTSLFKEAQGAYMGVQGYWLRNRRCWDNCYRHKRTTEPKKAAQEVWMDCWEEYRESINNDESGWEKYASGEKRSNEEENKRFFKIISEKIKKGMKVGEAVYSTLEKETSNYVDVVTKNANDLLDLSGVLKVNGYEDMAEKLAIISADIIKEAQTTVPFPK